jgi:hypothetical protein
MSKARAHRRVSCWRFLAEGYRVRSPRGVQFRRWATTFLSEYFVKSFTMDDERRAEYRLPPSAISIVALSPSWEVAEESGSVRLVGSVFDPGVCRDPVDFPGLAPILRE